MHAVPPTIWIVVVPAGVTTLLGFVIHHVVGLVRWVPLYLASLQPLVWIPCCAIGLIKRPKSVLQDSPEV
jgi:hypothetical protein